MGCDIHLSVEVRDKKTGKWNAICVQNPYATYTNFETKEEYHPEIEPYMGRDYPLFGILAGVRSDVYDRICEWNRGIPSDAAEHTVERWEDSKEWCHDATWYMLAELYAYGSNKKNFHSINYKDPENADILEETKKEDKYMRRRFREFARGIDTFVHLFYIYVPPEDIRVVMWFDS